MSALPDAQAMLGLGPDGKFQPIRLIAMDFEGYGFPRGERDNSRPAVDAWIDEAQQSGMLGTVSEAGFSRLDLFGFENTRPAKCIEFVELLERRMRTVHYKPAEIFNQPRPWKGNRWPRSSATPHSWKPSMTVPYDDMKSHIEKFMKEGLPEHAKIVLVVHGGGDADGGSAQKIGLNLESDTRIVQPKFDTCNLDRLIRGASSGGNLGIVSRILGCESKYWHNAAFDARMTLQCMIRMCCLRDEQIEDYLSYTGFKRDECRIKIVQWPRSDGPNILHPWRSNMYNNRKRNPKKHNSKKHEVTKNDLTKHDRTKHHPNS